MRDVHYTYGGNHLTMYVSMLYILNSVTGRRTEQVPALRWGWPGSSPPASFPILPCLCCSGSGTRSGGRPGEAQLLLAWATQRKSQDGERRVLWGSEGQYLVGSLGLGRSGQGRFAWHSWSCGGHWPGMWCWQQRFPCMAT